MSTQRLLIALTVVNLALLLYSLALQRPAIAQETAPVLRGRALEIVDERGRVRASIRVQPEDRAVLQPDGKPYPETVMLRLIDANGRPEVKLGASVQGGGLSLIGEFDTAHLLLQAQGAGTLVKLSDRDGRSRMITP